MRTIKKAIVHGSFSRPSQDWGVKELDEMHRKERGHEIGYHYVIRRDGVLERGRSIFRAGAHTRGSNTDSIGICLVGGRKEGAAEWENNYTSEQMLTLSELLEALYMVLGHLRLGGHRNFQDGRECPGFSVVEWDEDYMSLPVYDIPDVQIDNTVDNLPHDNWWQRLLSSLCKSITRRLA
jgi:N-acetylmuramoyl-L-alanine amidase